MSTEPELQPGAALALFIVGMWAGMAPPLALTDFDALNARLFETMFGTYLVVGALGLAHIGEKRPALRAALSRRMAATPHLVVFACSAAVALFATTVACGYAALHWPTWAQVVLTIPAWVYFMWRMVRGVIKST